MKKSMKPGKMDMSSKKNDKGMRSKDQAMANKCSSNMKGGMGKMMSVGKKGGMM